MKFLIISEDVDLRNLVTRSFKKSGWICEQAINFKEGYKKLIGYDYDCVIIDWDITNGDALHLLNLIRESDNPSGAILISARSAVQDSIKGLDAGADDYLVKPINVSELNARIRAILRRRNRQFRPEMNFGLLRINPDQRLATAGGEEIRLTKKEFDILLYLARNKNRVITKESIAEYLWGDYMDEAVSFDFIYAHVKNLRKKLQYNQCGEYLKTIYGVGYKFIA